MRWHKFLCSILIIGLLSGCQENRFKVKEVGSPSLEGEQVNLWNQYNEKDSNYKIGYIIEYKIEDREVRQVIYSPHDTEAIFNDIQVYLYDDIHQDKKAYSHVTNDDYDKDTVFTSIKLTASTNIDKVSSPITLKVFV